MHHGKHVRRIQVPQSKARDIIEDFMIPISIGLVIFMFAVTLAIIPIGQSVKEARADYGVSELFAGDVVYDMPEHSIKIWSSTNTWDDPTNYIIKERAHHEWEKKQAKRVTQAIADIKAYQEEQQRIAEEEAAAAEAAAYYESAYSDYSYTPSYSSTDYSGLMQAGVQYDENYRYTWYSQNVLPGGGLVIPGRHVGKGGYVMDGDDNIVVASSDLAYGTEISTPYGNAKVYDSGCASGTIDVYTNW